MAAPPPTSYRSSPPSSYGERPALYGGRRSFTTPHRQLSFHERAGLEDSDASAEILYSHPSTRIIKFTPPTDGIHLSSKSLSIDTDYPVDAIEVLPWASTTESLLATGPLMIEKVRGSTNFLRCKDVNQVMMRNSQCWLVDRVSKFVLRVGHLQYYRIELPADSEDDIRRVENFKEALKKILRFEITPCPFKRGFHVELAESDLTPRRKGQWKRRESSLPSSPLSETIPPLRHKTRMWQSRTISNGLESPEESSPLRADSGYGESPADERELDETQPTSTAMHNQSDSQDGSDEEKRTPDEMSNEIEAMLSPLTGRMPESEPEETIMTAVKVSDTPSIEGDAQEVEDENHATTNASSLVPSPIIEPAETNEEIKLSPVSEIQHEDSLSPPKNVPERNHSKSPANSLGVPDSLANSQESLLFSLLLADTRRPPQPFPAHENRSKRDAVDLDVSPDPSEGGANNLSRRSTLDSVPDDMSLAESTDSFHTSASIASSQDICTPKRDTQYYDGPTPLAGPHELEFWSRSDSSHRRDISEMTITTSNWSHPDLAAAEPSSRMPHPSSPIIQTSLRHRLRTRRSLSPLTPSSTMVRANRSDEDHHLTAAILQKAARMALGKPVEFVALMVHIIARVASGATMSDLMSGELFRKPPQARRRTQSMSLPDRLLGRDPGFSDSEDDYGIPIRGRTRSGGSNMSFSLQDTRRDDDRQSVADSLADVD